MPNVRMPDGAIVSFPDDMPQEEIRKLISIKFPDVASEDKGRGTSLAAGIRGFNAGVENRGRGIAQAGLSAIDAIIPGEQFTKTQENLAKGVKKENRELEEMFPDNPEAREVGKVIGDIGAQLPALAAMPGGFVAQSAIGGGFEAATRPSETEISAGQRVVQGGVGTVSGAISGKTLSVAGKTGGKLVIKAGEKMGKLFGQAKTTLSDIFSNLEEYGIEQNLANEAVKKTLGSEYAKMGKKVNAAYTRAKKTGVDIALPKNKISALADEVSQMVERTHLPDSKKALTSLGTRLRRMAAGDKYITVNDLESVRTEASKTSAGGVREAMELARKIDDFLINEDKTVGKLWTKAIGLRREMALKFEEPETIAQILKSGSDDEVSNLLWGAAAGAKPGAASGYEQVLKAVPKKMREDAGLVMRQSLINKIMTQSARNVGDVEAIDGQQIIRSLGLLRKERPDLWSKFTPGEKTRLNQLVKELRDRKSGDPVTKVGRFMYNNIRAVKHVELPSTMKPKSSYSLEDVIAMSKIRPRSNFVPAIGGVSGAAISRNVSFE